MNHDEYAMWDGAYVLGALSSSERREFEDHLSECARCNTAVAEITVLPGLLAAVPRSIALAEPASPPLPTTGREERLFSAIRAHRRRIRFRDTAVAAAAAVLIAVPVGVFVQQYPIGSSDPVASVQLVDVQPTVIDASADVTPHSWGTSVSLECTYTVDSPGTGERYGTDTEEYALTVTDTSGRVSRIATWIGAPGDTVTPTGTTSVGLDEIASIDVRATDSGEVLLTAPV
ncbi:zf-HC2 domain-containing protein [Rhodococcus sp. 14-2483-1-1]|uniref:anti-sigma factor family protein n=1 Tax=Rhodococcus sp. 14-2483-1-1 TaxID=2023148 RepID=UPI002016019B|nr:zf-HC2 domain-containing protein [Rhodococcus sp. 14-2483-1-1]